MDTVKVLSSSPTQEATSTEITQDLEKIKLPYVLKNKVLMSAGKWNGVTYDTTTLSGAFQSTDFTNKEINSLFLNHSDKDVNDWVGSVSNVHLEGENILGDLNIVDKPTAIKLAFGAKFGISPKVSGVFDENTSVMQKFGFNNFSIVIDPAVKTAYINNSQMELEQVTAMEAKRKELGMSVSEFYAIPRDPPSESKLPIFDEAHVRNALARVNQVEGVSSDEKAKALEKIHSAANKFGIGVEKKMETKTEEMSDVILNELKDSFKAFKENYLKNNPNATESDCMNAYKEQMKGKQEKEVQPEMACKKESVKTMSDEKVEKIEEVKTQTLVENDKVGILEARLAKLEKLQSSERITQELGEVTTPQTSGDDDVDFLHYLQKMK